MSIRIEGADRLIRRLRNKVDHKKINGVIRRSTSQVQEKAQRNAPVDTGFLKRGIEPEMNNSLLEGRVTAGASYSAYVEFGTRFMSSQPFLFPSLREQAPVFLYDLRQLIKNN